MPLSNGDKNAPKSEERASKSETSTRAQPVQKERSDVHKDEVRPKAKGVHKGVARLYKSERLKSKTAIQSLFERKSASVSAYPLRLVYAPAEPARGNYPIQVAVSVPKRRFKRAVDRNRIKRLMREAYRLNKENLYERLPSGSPQYAWMLLYTGKDELSYRRVEKKMRQVMDKFIREIQ